MAAKLSKDQRALIEKELRRGTSKSRIATLLNVEYDEGLEMIEKVKASIRPDIGDKITFTFRGMDMTGIIVKLLTNSAVVEIYWDKSDKTLHDIIEERTIVNFKDIIDFVTLPPQDEDEGLILDSQPTVSDFEEEDEAADKEDTKESK